MDSAGFFLKCLPVCSCFDSSTGEDCNKLARGGQSLSTLDCLHKLPSAAIAQAGSGSYLLVASPPPPLHQGNHFLF